MQRNTFFKNTDENHPTTIKDIIDYFETEHDILAKYRSVLRDILILRDEFGFKRKYFSATV